MSRFDAAAPRRAAWSNAVLAGGVACAALAFALWHRDGWQWPDPGATRWLQAALVLGLWAALAWWRRAPAPRQPQAQAEALHAEPLAGGVAAADTATPASADTAAPAPDTAAAAAPDEATGELLVVYASQTGFAEQLARQTLQSLLLAELPARLVGFDALTLDDLAGTTRVLFVVSTTGDGDPPDMAVGFHARAMQQPAALERLRYGLLALGDHDYETFCGFGHTLDAWLRASGATALFDLVEVDSEDEAALRHWQHRLAVLTGVNDLPDWQPPKYEDWTLVERRLLNSGSAGEPCYDVVLKPAKGRAYWEAGDLVEIGPAHAAEDVAAWLARNGYDGATPVPVGRARLRGVERKPLAELLARCRLPADAEVQGLDAEALAQSLQYLPHREYSIASIPDDGAVHLLVRRMRGEGGYLGLGSGWLTTHAPIGATVALRVRENANFHAPGDDRPLILIGNGTGLAALYALLKERIANGMPRNWLLFGERNAAHDFHHGEEIAGWLAAGDLERLDCAWSRDQNERVYVQDKLREAGDTLRDWVAEGAAIYVCGSQDGLAPGVDAALRAVLGTEAVDALRAEGRYRRDVY